MSLDAKANAQETSQTILRSASRSQPWAGNEWTAIWGPHADDGSKYKKQRPDVVKNLDAWSRFPNAGLCLGSANWFRMLTKIKLVSCSVYVSHKSLNAKINAVLTHHPGLMRPDAVRFLDCGLCVLSAFGFNPDKLGIILFVLVWYIVSVLWFSPCVQW